MRTIMEESNEETSSTGTAPLFVVGYPESETDRELGLPQYSTEVAQENIAPRVERIENINTATIEESEKECVSEETDAKDEHGDEENIVEKVENIEQSAERETEVSEKVEHTPIDEKEEQPQEENKLSPRPHRFTKRIESDPSTWDPLLKMSPKINPHRDEEPLSKCPHCRKVELECRLPPLEQLPPTRTYRFRDEESRLPPLEQLPPTRHYRFAETDVGTARVYPDPEPKYVLTRPPFFCMLPFYIINLLYLAWLIADLCYSYGPYTRFKRYFTDGSDRLNRGMEIFAGVFIFLTNMAIICRLVWQNPDYTGPSFSTASRRDKKWIARVSILGFLPLVMLIIVAAIRKNIPMVLPEDKPIPTCENLGHPTHIQFAVLNHTDVRGNHTNMANWAKIWNDTSSATLAFDNIVDPENPLAYTFALTKLDGDIRNVTATFFVPSHQYTVNYHTVNDTDNSATEYVGGSWQDSPNFSFPNLLPMLKSKKLENWKTKAFSEGSFLELFADGVKKPWIRTLDRDYNTKKTFMEVCSSGGVEDLSTLVPAGVLLVEFAKYVYDTTDDN